MELIATKKTVPRNSGPSKAQFCMVCLNTNKDCKLYPASKYNLNLEFQNLTGISLDSEVYFMPQFCTECAQRLSNCSKFRDKCLNAYHLLLGLVEMNKLLTTRNLKTLCKSSNLTSSIAKRSFQPDHCDLHVIHQEQETQQETNNKTIKIEVKLLDSNLIADLKDEENKITEINEPKTEKIDILSDAEDETNFDSDIIYNDTRKRDKKVKEAKSVVKKIKKPKKKEINDFNSDVECIDDEVMTHSDIELERRVKEKCDKFKNDIMNDTDDDWDFLKDSGSDSDTELGAENVKDTPAAVADVPRKRKHVRKAPDPNQEFMKQFKVTELTHEEQLADVQSRKEKENFKNSPYKCMQCFKVTLNQDTYNAHMERHTDKYGKSVCPVCGVHFRNSRFLRNHVTNSHSTRYSCIHCNLVTNHKVVAVNHARWHKGTTYKCPHCLEELRSKTGYFSHLRIWHPTDVVCVLCGFSFINERGLAMHLNTKHRGENVQNPEGPLCEPCNIRFASPNAYHQHLEVSTKHSAGGRHKRNTPKRKLDVLANRKRYQTYQHKRTVTCELCGMQVESFHAYNRHFRHNHPGKTRTQHPPNCSPSLCELCGKSFRNRYVLKDHMLQHSGKREFQCDLCKRSFFVKFHLVTHMRTHSEHQPVYECPVCQKKFVNKANCNRHIWTHKDHKPYKCQACDKTYVNASSLRSHVEHAHLKKPYPKKSRGPRLRASRARHAKEAVCGTIWPKPDHTTSGAVAEFPD